MRNGRAKLTHFLFSLPALVLYTFIWGYNVVWGLVYSLTNWDGLGKSWSFVGLANYTKILNSARFWSSLSFTVTYALALLVCVMAVALTFSLVLNRKGRFTNFYRSVFFLPTMISLVTAALIFDKLYYYALPALGQLLGIPALERNILADPSTALLGILLVNLWQGCAIPTVLLIAGLQNVPPELHEAAAIDGASSVQRFWSVTVPFLLPIISVVFVLTLKAGITVFDYVLVLTEGGPAGTTNSVSMLIYNDGFGAFRFGYANAEAILLLIVIAGVSFVQIKLSSCSEVG